MSVNLTPEQEAWLSAHVARGEFPSLADAVRQLIDERIAERMAEENDDLSWARPYVDQALADVAGGNVLTRQEQEARIDALLASMKA
jgi:antitoxin ParD1/3/4